MTGVYEDGAKCTCKETLSFKKEGNSVICDNMEGLGGDSAK
jgi:hypothetical protein